MSKLRYIFFIIFCLAATTTLSASEYKYYLGVKGGLSTLSGGDSAKFTFQNNFGGDFGFRVSNRWLLNFGLTFHRNYNDTGATSSFSFGSEQTRATQRWKATRLELSMKRFLLNPDKRLNMTFGLGGGLMIWEINDPTKDTTLKVRGIHNEQMDYSATEIFVTANSGLRIKVNRRWSLEGEVQGDYLTGAGAEFASAVSSARNKWQWGGSVALNFHFGNFGVKKWSSVKNWSAVNNEKTKKNLALLDSDGDGVPDAIDHCLSTPRGATVDKNGCALDSDGDGIADVNDDCPHTDRQAIGMVDINGCPIDADFDGVPDYLDSCPHNRIGAKVDEKGCPLDSDGDGVPDGLDDCPHTLYGMKVDQLGCIDLSIFDQPMVLNIDYAPGSFEVDPKNRERLKDLARILNFVDDIKLEIDGYTDNIGTTVANKKLSEKRARRVRDYLVMLGVKKERMKVFGKGETNFVASNQTAAGRAKNRRIEIIFFK